MFYRLKLHFGRDFPSPFLHLMEPRVFASRVQISV